ncbi:MAG: signal peptide peptidase SppA [Planctomycetota bacterium]
MSRIAMCWILGLTFGLPVFAQEPTKGDEPKKTEEPKKMDEQQPAAESAGESKKDEDAESPIPKLVEVRLDEYVVPARMINLPIPGKTRTLQDILDRFEKWSKDERVGAVLLNVSNLTLPLADVQELRGGLARLHDAKKKVFAFLNAPTPQGYLLASAADELAIPPTGAVVIPGLGSLFPFMKGYYQLQGLEFEVITAGRYKYPGFVNSRAPSESFLEEFNTILDSWYGDYRDMLVHGRKLTADQASAAIDVALFDAHAAQQRGLVDLLAYQDDYREQVLKRERMRRQRDEDDGLGRVNSIQDLMELINETLRQTEEARKAVGPKIAVLHARGPIIDRNLGAAYASMVICRDDFRKVVDELRRNKSIKAVVLRVDSPGGSGYASDVIWRALRELNEEKPLVVSMGSVAGSGGYYIACPARRIFAQPTTITGSIGVIGMMQCAQSALNRMDFEITPMQRGARALLGAPHRELSKENRAFIQDYINNFYGIFVERVAVTRRIPVERVREIAEGRIYTGRQAKDIGLVDELGGLEDAIRSARQLAEIPPSAEVRMVHYPRPSSLGEIFESLGAMGVPAGVNALLRLASAAPVMSFDQQLLTFSARLEPLCWMAMPDLSPSPTMPPELLQRLMTGPTQPLGVSDLLPAQPD